jgi:hypothetical protein
MELSLLLAPPPDLTCQGGASGWCKWVACRLRFVIRSSAGHNCGGTTADKIFMTHVVDQKSFSE